MSKSIAFGKGDFTVVPNKNALKGQDPDVQTLHFWLAAYSNNETHQCWPSIEELVEACGMGKHRVIKATTKLIELGLVKKDKRKHESNSSWNSNLYTLLIKELVGSAKTEQPSAEIAQGLCQNDTRVVPKQHSNYTNLTNTTNVVQPAKPGSSYGNPQINKLIEAWNEKIPAYPVKSSHGESRRYAKILLNAYTLEEVIKSLQLLASNRSNRFVPAILDIKSLYYKWNSLKEWDRRQKLSDDYEETELTDKQLRAMEERNARRRLQTSFAT